ncbi:MAG: hypothetical protein A2Y96_00175 [Firmicutes bacterium RBG_13_65_8]|nr:MAG: hypothetical protein A2Y96_00175 [Firmicutes bacterium RBG_13_65_8]
MAANNRTLGRFHLVGIPPAPRGIPQIEVTFDIDANGIVNVSAKDLGTSKEQRITITASTQLNKDEVERLVRESQAHAEEDRKQRDQVEARNLGDSVVYRTEKMLKDIGDKVSAQAREGVQSAVDRLKEALKGNDTEAIKKATDEVNQASYPLSEELYRQTAAGPGAGGPTGAPGPEAGPEPSAPSGKPGGDVIDAEFKATDERDRPRGGVL